MSPEGATTGADKSRPVFWEDLGRFFAELRKKKGWGGQGGQSQAANVAAQKKLKHATRQNILRLEAGLTKNPNPLVLRDIATLYEVPYEALVAAVIRVRYGLSTIPIINVVDVIPEPNDPEPLALAFKGLRELPPILQAPVASSVVMLVAAFEALRKSAPRNELPPETRANTLPIPEQDQRRSDADKQEPGP